MFHTRAVLALFLSLGTQTKSFSVPPNTNHASGGFYTITISTSRRADSRSNTNIYSTNAADISDLPLPPRKGGPLRRFRDMASYLKGPDRFLAQRSKELDSQIFQYYDFFRLTTAIGGQDAIQEFSTKREAEATVIHSALPPTFQELHTEWGALNLDSKDVTFKQSRSLFTDVLAGLTALEYHTKIMEPIKRISVSAVHLKLHLGNLHQHPNKPALTKLKSAGVALLHSISQHWTLARNTFYLRQICQM